MRFHQGYFGATPSGHDLLACAPKQRELFLSILDRTDVQGILPPGATFDTYVTAFRVEKYFVLMRTSIDEKATRAGMVFSHVLIASEGELSEVPSISKAIDALKYARPEVLDVADLEVAHIDIALAEVEPPRPLINALLMKNKQPLLWPDCGNFIESIDAVWRNAWPELRALLTFTMGLSPDDAHLSEYSVLYVPEALTARWPGFQIIPLAHQSNDFLAGAAALAGGPGSAALRTIAEQVSWPPANFAVLKDLEELRERIDRVSEDPREEIRTLRLLCFTAPAATAGVDLKNLVFRRATSTLIRASLVDVLACRNLRLSCIAEQASFWRELSRRVTTLFSAEYSPVRLGQYVEFLRRIETEPSSFWHNCVVDGIRRAIDTRLTSEASHIFDWIGADPSLSSLVFSFVPQTDSAEGALMSALPPEMSQGAINALLSVLASSSLPNLRARCLAAYLSVEDAFDWELATVVTVSALPALASHYLPKTVVSQAVRTEDERLLPFAIAAVKLNPILLTDWELDSRVWTSIIKQLRGSTLTIARDAHFVRIQKQMVNLMQSGEGDTELLSSLGTLGFFDLSVHSTSSDVWAAIPAALLQDFVKASICGAVEKIVRSEATLQDLTEPLRKSLENRVSAISCLERLELLSQIKAFAVIPALSQADFRGWYSSIMTKEKRVACEAAKEIGLLIAKRSWRDAAEQVANDYLSYRRFDLGAALSFLAPLLGTFARFRLMLSGAAIRTSDFASDDLWDQLEMVLVERFTMGPREHGLWDKSKGHDADLLIGGSAREQWHHALRLVRYRQQHAPKLDKLLEEARNIHSDQHLTWFRQNVRYLLGDTKG